MQTINFKMKRGKLLTNERQESYENAKLCYICRETFAKNYAKDKIQVSIGCCTYHM